MNFETSYYDINVLVVVLLLAAVVILAFGAVVTLVLGTGCRRSSDTD